MFPKGTCVGNLVHKVAVFGGGRVFKNWGLRGQRYISSFQECLLLFHRIKTHSIHIRQHWGLDVLFWPLRALQSCVQPSHRHQHINIITKIRSFQKDNILDPGGYRIMVKCLSHIQQCFSSVPYMGRKEKRRKRKAVQSKSKKNKTTTKKASCCCDKVPQYKQLYGERVYFGSQFEGILSYLLFDCCDKTP